MAEARGPCAEGTCGPILTAADNPATFDPSVLGETPNAVHYGYCATCLTPWHWSPARMGWEKWER